MMPYSQVCSPHTLFRWIEYHMAYNVMGWYPSHARVPYRLKSRNNYISHYIILFKVKFEYGVAIDA